MQKEDLLKRIRLWATLITTAFVVLIVALVIQFGLIAHNNAELTRLRSENAAKRALIENTDKENAYYENTFGDEYLIENGKQPD